ncbi:hypothetical protein V9J75_002572 [Vibrio fluvialis]
MDTSKLYSPSFPEKYKVQDVDVVMLYHEGRFAELDNVIICNDEKGNITATFGQSIWNLLPFSRNTQRYNWNFEYFDDTPNLQREIKLLSFGFLFNKSPQRKKALSFSGASSRVSDLIRIYRFLTENNDNSLKALSTKSTWSKFETYLQQRNFSQKTLGRSFASLNASISYESWHKLDLGIELVKSKYLAKRLSYKEEQQTLVIPERLCNAIYGKAIELVEYALPHKQLIADTENALQDNYLEGKRILDEKVKQGSTFTFMNETENTSNRKYVTAISFNKPRENIEIIAPLAEKMPDIKLESGLDFRIYLGDLITACYIVCGGFSGMRESELGQLTPDSYCKDTFDGRDYHMLQSSTFKLGEKRETWVTASSAAQAIELMTTLTKTWRQETFYPNEKHTNTLWVNRAIRLKVPVLIHKWGHRLERFCKHYNFIVTEDDYQECLESNPRSQKRVKKNIKVGSPWYLSSHQFRRTLAFYCIKNRLGTLVALKQQFKHLYLAMTEWYTNGGRLASLRDLKVDQKVKHILEDINAESTANKIFKQWHSDERLSGSHGKTILKMRGNIPHIYSSWDIIYKAVKEGKLTLHGTAHSYCKSGYECDMDGVVTPQFCVDCSSGSSIIDEQQAKWWQKKHRSLVAYMESGEDISVIERSHYITQIRAAENVMSDFEMDFTLFEAGLNIKEIV